MRSSLQLAPRRARRARTTVGACLASALLLGLPAGATSSTYVLDGSTATFEFDGHGGLSAGGTSRLLTDYPAKEQGEILDYLFKPNFGAGLGVVKIEIGA